MAITVTIPDGLVAAIKQLPRTDPVGFGSFTSTEPKITAANLVRLINDAERAQGQTHSYGDGCEPAHDAVEHARNVLSRAADEFLCPDCHRKGTAEAVDAVVREQLSFKPAVHEPDAVEPWNHVTFGDGTTGWLRPFGSYNEILNDDGSIHCNHGDHVNCVRTGHTTRITYYVDPQPAAVHEPDVVGEPEHAAPTNQWEAIQADNPGIYFDEHGRPVIAVAADRDDG